MRVVIVLLALAVSGCPAPEVAPVETPLPARPAPTPAPTAAPTPAAVGRAPAPTAANTYVVACAGIDVPCDAEASLCCGPNGCFVRALEESIPCQPARCQAAIEYVRSRCP